MTFTPEDFVDLERYPVASLESDRGRKFVESCRQEFVETGLCELPGFVSDDGVEALALEGNHVAGRAWVCESEHNAWLSTASDLLPGSVFARKETTRVGSVAYDQIGNSLRGLYEWDALSQLIAGVLGKTELNRLADPLGACSLNVFTNSGVHGWHFDEAEFTITLMLQAPESGGAFEFVPGIRDTPDETARVSRVLDGDRDGVRNLPFTPGTLLIFGGRQSIHRVTDVHGATPRLVAVLCYADQPDVKNSPEVQRLFWGRTA